MTEAPEDLLAAFGGRFRLLAAYAGGEGCTLQVDDREAAAPRQRVLKVLPAGVEPQEAALLLALQHPAIPAIREVGRLPDGRGFVLRDHVDGSALETLPTEPGALLAALQELLPVLAYVHLRGIVHLDLKPANLLRDAAGRLHLPPSLRRDVLRRLAGALTVGGLVVVESFHPRQLGRASGGPQQIELLQTLADLRADFAGLVDEVLGAEVETVLAEGEGHRGEACVTRFVGRRR